MTDLNKVTNFSDVMPYVRRKGKNFIPEEGITITLKEGDVHYFDISQMTGNGNESIYFKAEKTYISNAKSISYGDRAIELIGGKLELESYIVIEGDVKHESYTPERQKNICVTCKIVEKERNNYILDKEIPYEIENVKIFKIPNTQLIMIGQLNNIAVDIENIATLDLVLTFNGTVSKYGVFLNITNSFELNGSIHFNECKCVIGVAFNYISGGKAKVTQQGTGGVDNDSKVCRGNGTAYFDVIYEGENATFRDFGFHAARKSKFFVKSNFGGGIYHDKKDSSGNRLESVVFAECDDIIVDCNIKDANDQGLEFISCTNTKVYGYISNAKGSTSTEGAMVIKAYSADVYFYGEVYAYGSRGVKVECLQGARDIHFMKGSYITSEDNTALSIREGVEDYDANVHIRGTYKGKTGIEIKPFANNCTIDAIVDMQNSEVGIVIQSRINEITLLANNTQVNKQIMYIGMPFNIDSIVSVSGDTDDCFVQLEKLSLEELKIQSIRNVKGFVRSANAKLNLYIENREVYSSKKIDKRFLQDGETYFIVENLDQKNVRLKDKRKKIEY